MNIEVGLTVKTCLCGGVYAVPLWMVNNVSCPMCGHRERLRLLELIGEKSDRIIHLTRVNTSLRGALTVAKRRR